MERTQSAAYEPANYNAQKTTRFAVGALSRAPTAISEFYGCGAVFL